MLMAWSPGSLKSQSLGCFLLRRSPFRQATLAAAELSAEPSLAPRLASLSHLLEMRQKKSDNTVYSTRTLYTPHRKLSPNPNCNPLTPPSCFPIANGTPTFASILTNE
jgi:hypothetical protein